MSPFLPAIKCGCPRTDAPFDPLIAGLWLYGMCFSLRAQFMGSAEHLFALGTARRPSLLNAQSNTQSTQSTQNAAHTVHTIVFCCRRACCLGLRDDKGQYRIVRPLRGLFEGPFGVGGGVGGLAASCGSMCQK